MRVFFATASYYPSSGGVQSVTKYMAEGLAKRNYYVEVVTQCERDTAKADVINGVKVVRFKHRAFTKIHFGEKSNYRRYLLDNLTKSDVLIVVCAQSYAAQWIYPIVDKISAKKIMYMHGMRGESIDAHRVYSCKTFIKELILTTWWNIYFRRYWNKICRFDACIHLFEKDSSFGYFERNGFNNNYILQNSCDSIFFSDEFDSSVKYKYNIYKPYFIFVANYDDNKNQIMALEAYKQANVSMVDLVFVGSKKNKYMKKLVGYLNYLDDDIRRGIHILENIDREDTINLIKGSYAVLLTSHSEYFPISVIEGMASKKAFLSTNVGEVPKFVGGHIAHTIDEVSYWIKYYEKNEKYVQELGAHAYLFALDNMELNSKIDEMERIINDV